MSRAICRLTFPKGGITVSSYTLSVLLHTSGLRMQNSVIVQLFNQCRICQAGLLLPIGNTVAIRSFTVLLPYCYRIAIGDDSKSQIH